MVSEVLVNIAVFELAQVVLEVLLRIHFGNVSTVLDIFLCQGAVCDLLSRLLQVQILCLGQEAFSFGVVDDG